MLKWVKGELKEHWLAWLGMIVLLAIGIPLVIYAGQHTAGAYYRASMLLLVFIGWPLIWLGLYMEQQAEKYQSKKQE